MKPNRCQGMKDMLTAEMAAFRLVEGICRESCRKWGYREVRTPTIEYLYLFTSAGTLTPDRLGKVYSFLDWDGWSGERVVLRPDGTIPVARMYAENLEVTDDLNRLLVRTDFFAEYPEIYYAKLGNGKWVAVCPKIKYAFTWPSVFTPYWGGVVLVDRLPSVGVPSWWLHQGWCLSQGGAQPQSHLRQRRLRREGRVGCWAAVEVRPQQVALSWLWRDLFLRMALRSARVL